MTEYIQVESGNGATANVESISEALSKRTDLVKKSRVSFSSVTGTDFVNILLVMADKDGNYRGDNGIENFNLVQINASMESVNSGFASEIAGFIASCLGWDWSYEDSGTKELDD